MKELNKIFLTAIAFTAFSCTMELEPSEYVHWITDYENGHHVRKNQGDFAYDVQFAPEEYLKLQNKSRADVTTDLQYYILNISTIGNTTDLVDFQSRDNREKQFIIYYYSYTFQNDIVLEDGDEQMPCVLYHFERSADFNRSRTFVLGFERSNDTSGEVKLVINSQRLGSLPVKINISKNNIPVLLYDKNI